MPASRAGHQGQERKGINTSGFCSLGVRRIKESCEHSLVMPPVCPAGTAGHPLLAQSWMPCSHILPCPVSLTGLSVLLVWRVDFLGEWRPAGQVHCTFLFLSLQQQLLGSFLSIYHPMPGFCCCWHRTILRSLPKNTAAPMRAPTPPKCHRVPGHPPLCLYPPGGEWE